MFLATCLCVGIIWVGVLNQSTLSYENHMGVHLLVLLGLAPIATSLLTITIDVTRFVSICLVISAVLIPAYHLTSLGSLVMQSGSAYGIELVVFFLFGIYLWIPIYARSKQLSPLFQLAYTAITTTSLITTGLVLHATSKAPLHDMVMAGSTVNLTTTHRAGMVMIAGTLFFSVLHFTVIGKRALTAHRSLLFAPT